MPKFFKPHYEYVCEFICSLTEPWVWKSYTEFANNFNLRCFFSRRLSTQPFFNDKLILSWILIISKENDDHPSCCIRIAKFIGSLVQLTLLPLVWVTLVEPVLLSTTALHNDDRCEKLTGYDMTVVNLEKSYSNEWPLQLYGRWR